MTGLIDFEDFFGLMVCRNKPSIHGIKQVQRYTGWDSATVMDRLTKFIDVAHCYDEVYKVCCRHI